MVKFGQLSASFAGTVTWVGPNTLKVGKSASLTLRNNTAYPITVEKIVETRKLEESSTWLETGSNWSLLSEEKSNPKLITIGPGKSETAKGQQWIEERAFRPDWKYEKRKYITYVGTEEEQEVDEAAGNSHYTDPPDPVGDDTGYDTGGLGPVDEFGTPSDDGGSGSTGLSGSRSFQVLLLLIVVLMAAGGGYAARGVMIRRTLGLA